RRKRRGPWASVGPSSEQRNDFAAVTRLRTVPRTARSGVKDAARHSGSRLTPSKSNERTRALNASRKDVAHGSKVSHRAGRKSKHHDRDRKVGEAGGWLGSGARRRQRGAGHGRFGEGQARGSRLLPADRGLPGAALGSRTHSGELLPP